MNKLFKAINVTLARIERCSKNDVCIICCSRLVNGMEWTYTVQRSTAFF